MPWFEKYTEFIPDHNDSDHASDFEIPKAAHTMRKRRKPQRPIQEILASCKSLSKSLEETRSEISALVSSPTRTTDASAKESRMQIEEQEDPSDKVAKRNQLLNIFCNHTATTTPPPTAPIMDHNSTPPILPTPISNMYNTMGLKPLPEDTPSDEELENLFAEIDNEDVDFLTCKEAYVKDNPERAVIANASFNDYVSLEGGPEKFREMYQRIEQIRIQKIREQEEALQRQLQKATDAYNGPINDTKKKSTITKKRRKVSNLQSGMLVCVSNDDETTEEEESCETPGIDYSGWTIGDRADTLGSEQEADVVEDVATIIKKIKAKQQREAEAEKKEKQRTSQTKKKKKKVQKKQRTKRKSLNRLRPGVVKKSSQKKKKNSKKTKTTKKKSKNKKGAKQKQKQNKRVVKKVTVRKAQGFHGVYTRGGGRFFSTCRVNNKHRYIGSFDDALTAAKAFDAFMWKERGTSYKNYNFPRILNM